MGIQRIRYNFFGEQLPGYVPGQKPNQYNNGMSQKIPKGSDLVLQMHFCTEFNRSEDSSSVNLFFAKRSFQKNRL
ncbi:MAG: hypothetical protein IPO78_16480 [Saprospiraceae bacterium]|nr:hypothetical protein [Saprospiraceae bacterium]